MRDLLGAYGITKTKAALYEKRARLSSAGRGGYIDALLPGLRLFETKSCGKRLAETERQARDYSHDLPDAETPRWVATSDFTAIRVLGPRAAADADTEKFFLDELPQRAGALGFLAGYQTRSFGRGVGHPVRRGVRDTVRPRPLRRHPGSVEWVQCGYASAGQNGDDTAALDGRGKSCTRGGEDDDQIWRGRGMACLRGGDTHRHVCLPAAGWSSHSDLAFTFWGRLAGSFHPRVHDASSAAPR